MAQSAFCMSCKKKYDLEHAGKGNKAKKGEYNVVTTANGRRRLAGVCSKGHNVSKMLPGKKA